MNFIFQTFTADDRFPSYGIVFIVFIFFTAFNVFLIALFYVSAFLHKSLEINSRVVSHTHRLSTISNLITKSNVMSLKLDSTARVAYMSYMTSQTLYSAIMLFNFNTMLKYLYICTLKFQQSFV